MSHRFPLKFIIVTLVASVAGLMAGCSTPPPTPPPARVQPENVEVAVVPDPTPTTAPTPTPTAIVLPSDESCVECHTNEEMLKETASNEEVVEALSEGEG